MITLADTFSELFGNPHPSACYICGSTENLKPSNVTALIGDDPWLICLKCEAEANEREQKEAADRRREDAEWDFYSRED